MNNADNSILLSSRQIQCEVLKRGASVYRLQVLDPDGNFRNVILSLRNIEDYGAHDTYAGTILGPAAGRIRKGVLNLPSHPFQLAANDNGNTLHGGPNGLSGRVFTAGNVERKADVCSVKLTAVLEDGTDGWPGNRTVDIIYTVGPGMLFTIQMNAETDQPTYFDLSSHIYWNLSGNTDQSALKQKLMIHSSKAALNDREHLPYCIQNVDGTPFDFRTPRTIEAAVQKYPHDAQLLNAKGYNNWFEQTDTEGKQPFCELWDSENRLHMTMQTDASGIVLYSGGYLDQSTLLDDSKTASSGCAVALEAQDLPDALNNALAKAAVTDADHPFHRIIQYHFDWESKNTI